MKLLSLLIPLLILANQGEVGSSSTATTTIQVVIPERIEVDENGKTTTNSKQEIVEREETTESGEKVIILEISDD